MQECVSSDARSISAPSDGAQTKQLQQSTAAASLVPPVITLESLWLCTPFYYCQPIRTKASRIRSRIKLYTWEQDLREGNIIECIRLSLWDQNRRVLTSAQYCCLVSESMCANPPSTRAFIRDLCTELDSRWSGGLRLANCLARLHQLSHCTTMLALDGGTDPFRQIYGG